jgi:hypothetical protein
MLRLMIAAAEEVDGSAPIRPHLHAAYDALSEAKQVLRQARRRLATALEDYVLHTVTAQGTWRG